MLYDEVVGLVRGTTKDVRRYLASEEGERLRRTLATGMIATAPLLAQLPVVRATKIGRVVGFAGGAAAIVKIAEVIRDWQPDPRTD